MRQVMVRYFIHLAVTEAESEGSQLSKLRAFQEFQKHIDGGKRLGLADDFSTRTRAGGSVGAPS